MRKIATGRVLRVAKNLSTLRNNMRRSLLTAFVRFFAPTKLIQS